MGLSLDWSRGRDLRPRRYHQQQKLLLLLKAGR
jgi:hypothetical protein